MSHGQDSVEKGNEYFDELRAQGKECPKLLTGENPIAKREQ